MAAKRSSMDEFYKKIIKEDKDTIMDLSKKRNLDFIPTGSWVLNQIIGDGTMTGTPGGFPRGHFVEIFGNESSGKTTIGLSAIAKAQEMGFMGVLMDFEQTFHQKYAEKLGLDLSENKFLVSQPIHFQQGARQTEKLLEIVKPAIIVIDSVSAMLPKQMLEADADEAAIVGCQARLMSGFLQRISKLLQKSNTCLLFINQLRSVIKKSKYEPGPNEESSGGRALNYYSSLRIKLRTKKVDHVSTISKITGKKDKEPINVMVEASVVKNKIDRPHYSGPLYIRFGEGFDNILSIIELAINIGVIKKSGPYFSFENIKEQGKDAFRTALNENPKTFENLQNNLVLKEDEQVKKEYKDVKDDLPDEIDDYYDNIAEDFIDKQKKKEENKEEDEK